jgi:hypothetical protein
LGVARREMCVKGIVYTWCVLVARALETKGACAQP